MQHRQCSVRPVHMRLSKVLPALPCAARHPAQTAHALQPCLHAHAGPPARARRQPCGPSSCRSASNRPMPAATLRLSERTWRSSMGILRTPPLAWQAATACRRHPDQLATRGAWRGRMRRACAGACRSGLPEQARPARHRSRRMLPERRGREQVGRAHAPPVADRSSPRRTAASRPACTRLQRTRTSRVARRSGAPRCGGRAAHNAMQRPRTGRRVVRGALLAEADQAPRLRLLAQECRKGLQHPGVLKTCGDAVVGPNEVLLRQLCVREGKSSRRAGAARGAPPSLHAPGQ